MSLAEISRDKENRQGRQHERKHQKQYLVTPALQLTLLLLQIEAGFHFLKGLVLLLKDIFLHPENIVIVTLQCFLRFTHTGVKPHQAIVQG